METSIVTVKGQIVIPARIRLKLVMKKGTKVAIIEKEDGVIVEPITKKYFEKYAGILPGNSKVVKTLLEERRMDREREDRRS